MVGLVRVINSELDLVTFWRAGKEAWVTWRAGRRPSPLSWLTGYKPRRLKVKTEPCLAKKMFPSLLVRWRKWHQEEAWNWEAWKRLREGPGIFKKGPEEPSEDSWRESAVSRQSWCGLRPLGCFWEAGRREGDMAGPADFQVDRWTSSFWILPGMEAGRAGLLSQDMTAILGHTILCAL